MTRNRPLALSLALLVAAPALPAAARAAGPAGDEVTLERIMAHPDWIGIPPENPYWADDGRAVYYERKREGNEVRDLWRLDLGEGEEGEPRRVEDREKGSADVGGGDFSRDYKLKVYVRQGDVYLKDLTSGEVRQLTRTNVEESDPFFLADDRRVGYRRGDAVFVRDLVTGLESQPAELRLEEDPAEKEKKPEDDPALQYLKDQQLRLFEVLRDRKADREAEREAQREEQAADPTRAALPWYLGEGKEIERTSLSPGGRFMLVLLRKKDDDEGDPGKEDRMPRFVTESGYVDVEDVRPKVGTADPESPQILLLDLERHERHEIALDALPGIQEDPLKELREKAEAARKAAREKMAAEAGAEDAGEEDEEKEEEKEEEEKPGLRAVETPDILWNDTGDRVVLQLFSRDNKDRWIAHVDLEQGKLVPLERMTDPAWIGWSFNELGWLRDGRTLWYLSEETGFSHLYLRPLEGAERQLTRGELEVSAPVLSRDGGTFYLTANREHPGVYETYRLRLPDGPLERLTSLGGITTAVLSPDETRLLLLFSAPARPPELYLQAAEPGARARRLTKTISDAFAAIRWTEPEVVAVPSTHAARPVYSRVYLPAGWKDRRGGKRWPAVVFIHGAGYLQNAHKGWSTYFREFMFHSLLTRRGYVVLDMDYRASAGYGRDWRTAIYRQMGHPELEDLEDGVAWLVRERGVDRKRVGVYGGSYGGFLTFMALFRKPDLFACGAALRPVTDWAHYNHGYTSNILNVPEVDPEAYEKSSPIEYAAGLAKPLLIAHGMVDDNVVFQDTVRLVQRLIELEKENFETAIYPLEPHAFVEPTSWLDEYRRVYKLFETHLR